MLMLWNARHEWPSGARFTFDCCRHWSTLFVRGSDGAATMMHSEEGATQGCPLAMFGCGVLLLPLIRLLKREAEAIKQMWCADDSSGAGKFKKLCAFYNLVAMHGPKCGYHPEADESTLVVAERNVEAATESFATKGFKI